MASSDIAYADLALAAAPAAPARAGGPPQRERSVRVISGGVAITVPAQRVGACVDVKTLRPPSSAATRAHSRDRSRPGDGAAFESACVDEEAVLLFADHLRRQVETRATPALLDVAARRVDAAEPGVAVDVGVARSALREGLRRGARTIKVPTTPRIVVRDLIPKGFSIRHVLGRFETEFDRHGEFIDRAHNVALSAARIDGVMIPPGGVLSFNERVGARIPRHGFRGASVIMRGELTSGWGGGVCQAASTLHAAALFAGLEIVQHTPHSRPSSYIPMGLDATVVWPLVDLKVRNPHDFPLWIRSWTDDGFHRVEILGARAPREVTIDREFVATRPFARRVVVDPALEAGVETITQGGMLGYTMRRVRYIREGSEERIEEATIVYPPTDRVVRIGG